MVFGWLRRPQLGTERKGVMVHGFREGREGERGSRSRGGGITKEGEEVGDERGKERGKGKE